jgi:hypothetical protein
METDLTSGYGFGHGGWMWFVGMDAKGMWLYILDSRVSSVEFCETDK